MSRAIQALQDARRQRFTPCKRHPDAQHYESEGPAGDHGLVCTECWEEEQSLRTIAATEFEEDPS